MSWQQDVRALTSSLIVASDPADGGCVISKFDDGIGAVDGHTVVREQGVQERAVNAGIRGANVESQGGAGGAAWGSAHQEVQDPVTEGGVLYYSQ